MTSSTAPPRSLAASAVPVAEGEPVTPTDLVAEVRAARVAADTAEAKVMVLAVEWAHAHPVLTDSDLPGPDLSGSDHPRSDDPDECEWVGVPEVRWDAFAPFAAANHMSTTGGKALIRDALVVHHRLPRVWRRVEAGAVPAWRARRIAQAMLGEPDDVVAYVDQQVAHRAETLGPVTLDRVIDEANLMLHAEEREIEQLQALDARYAKLNELSINHTGIAEFVIRGDWPDVSGFDEAVAAVAAALRRDGCEESLDVRRSMAVGILADPERALALLNDQPAPKPMRRVLLEVGLSEAALAGVSPVLLDADGRPLLDQAVRVWCGRDDVRLTVRPVRHCGGCPECPTDLTGPHEHTGHAVEDYTPSRRDRETVNRRDRHCAFPYCTRPARRCDCDHRVAFASGGATCPCNLVPLCRHHHRLKTHAGWRYTAVEPGVYVWTDPHGQQFIRTRDGTRDVTTDVTSTGRPRTRTSPRAGPTNHRGAAPPRR